MCRVAVKNLSLYPVVVLCAPCCPFHRVLLPMNLKTDAPYPRVKLAIVGLLTLNILLFAVFDTVLTAIDATVWLLLLISYEIEAYPVQLPISQRHLIIIRRLLVACVPIPFVGYILTGEWLEAINALIWFLLIALIEINVSWPEHVVPFSRSYWLCNFLVFAALIIMVGVWLWRQEWLDAYDATLWIVAFAIIEADISHILKVPTHKTT